MVNNFDLSRCKNAFLLNTVALCMLWGFGLFVGFSFSFVCRDSLSSLMRSAFSQPVSIVFTVFCTILLFLFLFYRHGILLLVCFIKSICFGFTWMSIAYLFGSSGWVVRGLFLFSDTAMCLFLLLLMLDVNPQYTHKSTLCSAIICLAVVYFDYIVLSPLACGLF